jgi:hypothetical protein
VRLGAIVLVALGLLAAADDDGWTTYASREGGYTVRMPTKSESKVEKVPDYGGYIEVHFLSAQERGMAFAVYYHDLSAPVPAARRDTILKKQVDGTVRRHDAALRSINTITIDGKPARELVADLAVTGGGSAVLRAKIVLADQRIYQVIALATEKRASEPEIATFLDSFHVTLEPPTSPATKKRGGQAVVSELRTFSPESKAFSALFPDPPKERNDVVEGQELVVYECKDDGVTYTLSHGEFEASTVKDPKRFLDERREATLRSSQARQISETRIALGRNPGRALTAEAPVGDDPRGAELRCHSYLVGRRVYQLSVVMPKDYPNREKVQQFLNSLKLGPLK